MRSHTHQINSSEKDTVAPEVPEVPHSSVEGESEEEQNPHVHAPCASPEFKQPLANANASPHLEGKPEKICHVIHIGCRINGLQFQEVLFIGDAAVFTREPKCRVSLSDFGANLTH